jgi:Holliday junction resolvase RusA-like endonuclease
MSNPNNTSNQAVSKYTKTTRTQHPSQPLTRHRTKNVAKNESSTVSAPLLLKMLIPADYCDPYPIKDPIKVPKPHRIGQQTRANEESDRSLMATKVTDFPYHVSSMAGVRVGVFQHFQSMSFIIHGNPPVKQRHRVAYRTKSGDIRRKPNCYDATKKFLSLWRQILKDMLLQKLRMGTDCFPCFNDVYMKTNTMGLCLTVTFYIKRNRNDFIICNGKHVLKTISPKFPCNKDLDNLEKFVMDGLNGIIYQDDKVITRTVSDKQYINDYLTEAYTMVHLQLRY